MSSVLMKYGLKWEGLQPPITNALDKLDVIYPGLVVTSTGEQASGRKCSSKHYHGQAVDIRLKTCGGGQVDPERVRRILGAGYDVVPYDAFVHIEWDPKP